MNLHIAPTLCHEVCTSLEAWATLLHNRILRFSAKESSLVFRVLSTARKLWRGSAMRWPKLWSAWRLYSANLPWDNMSSCQDSVPWLSNRINWSSSWSRHLMRQLLRSMQSSSQLRINRELEAHWVLTWSRCRHRLGQLQGITRIC